MSAPDCLRLGEALTLTVPATSANLGPGFDSLGLALQIRDRMTVSLDRDGGLAEPVAEVDIAGHGRESLPRDASHLIVRLMLDLWRSRDVDLRGLRVSLAAENRIPHARGLGSSAAAIVAALTAANAMLAEDLRLTTGEIFQRASRLEGHPDNIAPALYGQMTVSWSRDSGEFATFPVPVHAGLRAVVGIPDVEVSTESVRAALPSHVPHATAAANSGRAALLTLALTREPDLLFDATRDYLHQEARASAMRPSAEAMRALRAEGVPAVISGAGPTVLALVRSEEEGTLAETEFRRCGFAVERPEFSADGVRVEE